jgi:predicted dehydrogenase
MSSAPQSLSSPSSSSPARPIRWGILGAGGIADKVCTDLVARGQSVITAVAARDAGRAADFAARHGALRSYGSYPDLVADGEVDVVYVATTHPYHHDHALLAIEAGRSVLIEKPVCLTAGDAREVFAAARQAGVFAMEAMWMRTNPLIRTAVELIAQGEIGEVVAARAEFGLGRAFDPGHRLYDPANGGGALLDLGIYPIAFAYLFLGRPDQVLTRGTLAPTGVDDIVAMEWIYDGVPRAQLWCSASTPAPNLAAVLGTAGWIAVEGATHRPTALVVRAGEKQYRIEDPIPDQHGYGPEIAEVERCLRAGLAESPLVTQADTIAVLELMDQAQADLGVIGR